MQSLFWSDQLARKILERKKYRHLNKSIPKMDTYTVKTSASLSGVLHIGRLSDTIRSESVHLSLKDLGAKTRLIWVAEDMDPLRKMPEGLPKNFVRDADLYLGKPVSEVPDPWGCHKSYSQHHLTQYMKVVEEFVKSKLQVYSTREEYEKGSFRPFIAKLLNKIDEVIKIQNKYRQTPLKTWFPWTPICKNCGKIITPLVKSYENLNVQYACRDYRFEETVAKGCGFEGESNPLKDLGKLLWKSEWASEWALWGVVAEGAGKEYQVPGSAFWVNAEICERILDFPSPEPIFYEHLMINGKKMSASLGNVVYPREWLEVARPKVLRYFYNKRLMKTRSFSWRELPRLYDEFDLVERVYFGREKVKKRDEQQMRRLYEISQLIIPTKPPTRIPYDFLAVLTQIYPTFSKIEDALREGGFLKGKLTEKDEENLRSRIYQTKKWVELYAPEEKFVIQIKPSYKVPEKMKPAIKDLIAVLGSLNQQQLYNKFYEICKKRNVPAKDFFATIYKVLINKPYGPRLAPFILAIGQRKVASILARAV